MLLVLSTIFFTIMGTVVVQGHKTFDDSYESKVRNYCAKCGGLRYAFINASGQIIVCREHELEQTWSTRPDDNDNILNSCR